jgi:hypothetical protein
MVASTNARRASALMSGSHSIESESVKKTIKINRKIDLAEHIDHKKWPTKYKLSVTSYEIDIVSEDSDYNDEFFSDAADMIRDSIHEALEAEYEKIEEWVAAHSISGEKITFRGEGQLQGLMGSTFDETTMNQWFRQLSGDGDGATIEMPKGLTFKSAEP